MPEQEGARTDGVVRQYERWRYPFPLEDLTAWSRNNWEWFDPRDVHRVLWPDREYVPDLDILIAGCGTNQAAVFAYTNPAARVVALDVSRPSLDHQQYLKDRHGLTNLTLHQLPVEDAPSLGLSFDLVVSTGVLHHLADPAAGLRALAACARPSAAIGLMVYGRYGRLGVDMLASVFEDLCLGQDDASVALVREALTLLPPSHPVHAYLALARDWGSDAALVDTFLHARQRSYTVDECLSLVASAGLVFQTWLLNAPYHLHDLSASPSAMSSALEQLPDAAQWSLMERLHPTNACHFLVACRPERPPASYVIDFESDTFRDYVPHLRARCGTSGTSLFRSDWSMTLTPFHLAFVEQVDGTRTIREIAASAAGSEPFERKGVAECEAFARELFRALWRLDFLAMGLGRSR